MSLRLIFFGGKGGVGKTTMAAASALLRAEQNPGQKILVISTDPAHSLGDSFEEKLGDDPVCAGFCKNIFLREFDAARALEAFKEKYCREIKVIADRGTYFDEADVDRFFTLSFPGIDEVMGILEIADLVDHYDTVIVDTAPTGHTLSMLKLPAILKKWMRVFALMGEKHHILEEHFAKHRSSDEADDFIKTISEKLTRVDELLRSVNETEFVVVVIPEEMVIDETNRLLHELFALKIPVHRIIINRVITGGGCPVCGHRSAVQKPYLEKLVAKASYEKTIIPLFPSEIKGIERLKMVATAIGGRGGTMDALAAQKVVAHEFKELLPLEDIDHADLIMIGGKGGVGKTTTSAATALLLAAKNEDRMYHLYSIDPAHSLGDCFQKSIGDKGVQVLKNLRVCELDADKLYLQFQEEYRSAINGIFDHFVGGSSTGRGMDLGYDRELLNELFEMAPPGLSELMALHQIISDIGSQSNAPQACILFDTAPTGHFVRFMELPALVRTWLKAIFELLLKYKGVVRLGEVAEKLVALSKNIRTVVDLMADRKKTAVIVVTIPKAMAVVETERLLKTLDGFHIRCDDIVINMATKTGECGQCAAFAADEAPWIKKGRKLRHHAAVVPYLAKDLGGTENLKEFGGLIWE